MVNRTRRFTTVSASVSITVSAVVIGLVGATALVPSPTFAASSSEGTFGSELQFLRRHTPIIVLSRPGGALVAVAPAYQGRIMTSAAGGLNGQSYGWLNHALIASEKTVAHFNALGGEDRFWLGPEGGQFGLFFQHGAPFDLSHWYTPAPIDTEPYPLVSHNATTARFQKRVAVRNYFGTLFRLRVDRTIRLLSPAATWKGLGLAPVPGVRMVSFESDNRITNTGRTAWTPPTGLLSIWILGQFNPGPSATIVIPFRQSGYSGPIVNDTYFGKVPANRLAIKDGVIFFKADGKYRSKIGVPPRRARPILGSYDPDRHLLTLVQYTLDSRPPHGYVNSMWEIQKEPYGGDVENSYNDGPTGPGQKPLGPFYELETSSPAAELTPGRFLNHVHRTIHLEGSTAALDRIARATLGVSLQEIERALPEAP